MTLDADWVKWNNSGLDTDFDTVMKDVQPIIDKAVISYAPNSSPAVRSKAKVLAAKAIRSFDPKQGTKLQTHLFTQMQPLQREAGAYTTVHAPERVHLDLKKVKEMQRQFFDEHGRDPNDDELADFTGLSRKRLRHIRKFNKGLLGEGVFEETSESGTGLPKTIEAANLWEDFVYSELGPQDKLIYDLKTGHNGRKQLPITAIARKLRISSGAVSQRLGRIANRIAEGKQLEQIYNVNI